MNNAWFALQVRSRFEKTTEYHLREKGYEVFLPTYNSRRRWSDRTKTIVLPLFPGYVFCRFDVGNRLPILVTPGVHAIVGIGRTPIAVATEEISALQRVVNSCVPALPCDYVTAGDMVRVEEGPLEGLVGIVLRAKNENRLILSMSLLMRSVSVEIDRTWVQPVKSTLSVFPHPCPSVCPDHTWVLADQR